MKTAWRWVVVLLATASAVSSAAEEAQIKIEADKVVHRASRLLTGACLEDVNHEIYGGLYSQMIFGERFQEPMRVPQPHGFKAYGGEWRVDGEGLRFAGTPGDKLVSELPPFSDGEVGVELLIADPKSSNLGLILRVANAGPGADRFDGYEVALDAAGQKLRLGRHHQNWDLIKDTPCEVPVGEWIPMVVKLEGRSLEVFVNGKSIVRHDDSQRPLISGTIGLRAFQREARYRNLWVKTGMEKTAVPFVGEQQRGEISGMWRPLQRGTAFGSWSLEKGRPFLGAQSQRLTFSSGAGEIGIENQGLNRWGMHLVGGKRYEGVLWARTDQPVAVWLALESADGSVVHAEKRIPLHAGDWQRLEFSLTPKRTEAKGRFVIKLKQPGSVALGYAFLEPGSWGRFKGLPVRRDVAEALIDQGITVLRYGGSMINHAEYKWKKMVGPRDRRPQYQGTWYPHSSNGWGILDFMQFCEAAGFEYIPAFNMDETPQDMADFIEYAKGSSRSEWGRKRGEDGHAKPYRLRYLELGNEERVDENYARKFEALASAIWAKDPEIILVAGDFVYGERIRDPMNFRGAASGITNMAGQKRILQFAKQHNREVWFDLHVGTDGPRPDATFEGMFSFRDALAKIAEGARHKVVVFEFNAGNHTQQRALANALAIQAIERDGQIPIATSANCLQPDGQNDNGWDQGLLFLNPSKVWLQPPGYVTRMLSRNYLPDLVHCETMGTTALDVNAKRSEDGKTLVVQIVNCSERPVQARIRIEGFSPARSSAEVTELAAPLDARNTAEQTGNVIARRSAWVHALRDGTTTRTFAPYSFTVLRLR